MCHFDTLCEQVKPCDVILVQGRSRVGSIIQSVTQSSWSHSLIYLGKINEIENDELRNTIRHVTDLSPTTPLIAETDLGLGTVIRPLSAYQDEHLRICRPRGLRAHDRDKIIQFISQQIGKEYSISHIAALLMFLLPYRLLPRKWMANWFYRLHHETVEVICSAMIAEAFNQVNFPILPHIEMVGIDKIALIKRNPSLYTPKDFDFSPYFAIVKYPMFSVTGHKNYHDLPWKADIIHNDDLGNHKNPI